MLKYLCVFCLLLSCGLLYGCLGGLKLGFLQKKAKSLELTAQQKSMLIKYVYDVLDKNTEASASSAAATKIKGDYDKIFVTFYTGNKLRGCQGSGEEGSKKKKDDIFKDLKKATLSTAKDKRFGEPVKKDELKDLVIEIDFLQNERLISNADFKTLRESIEPGVHALRLKFGSKEAFFKESVPVKYSWTLKKTMERLCAKADLRNDCYIDPRAKIFIYDTINFRGDQSGNFIDLHRGSPLLKSEEINKEYILNSLKLAYDWFSRNTDENGMIAYMYYPDSDKYSDKNRSHPRQIASTWAMSKTGNFLRQTKHRKIVRDTLRFYFDKKRNPKNYRFVRPSEKERPMLCHNAFLIMILLENPWYPNANAIINKLAASILSAQNPDGSFSTVYGENDIKSGMDFYPGEMMLSLMYLYEKNHDEKYLKAVRKAFDFYRDYWRKNKNTAFIPWHTQTYELLHKATGEPEIAQFIFEMNDWLIDNSWILDSEYQDEIGGAPKEYPNNSAYCWLEGINSAYSLAVRLKDEAHIAKYKEVIKKGTRFTLQLQFNEKNTFYAKNPEKLIGAFRNNLINHTVRNDYLQHATLSLRKTLDNEIFEQ